METIADTGFIVALLNQSDARHQDVVPIYTEQQTILIPQTVLAEVAYLLGRDAGISTVIAFLKGLPRSRFRIVALTDADLSRISDILTQYADSRIDFVDASVMSVAERLNIATILTLDQRDFRLFRPQHCQNFELLP
jgi:predicted nucleic acid-binding protein